MFCAGVLKALKSGAERVCARNQQQVTVVMQAYAAFVCFVVVFSVAQLLADRRKSILQGVVVQTAGMFKSETSHPEFGWHDNGPLHRRRLVRLGAHVVESPVPELTHIVAIRATQTLDRVRYVLLRAHTLTHETRVFFVLRYVVIQRTQKKRFGLSCYATAGLRFALLILSVFERARSS